MAQRVEVLRELHRVTERRGGAVYKTEYVRDVWVGRDETPLADHLLVVKGTDYEGPTIRTVQI